MNGINPALWIDYRAVILANVPLENIWSLYLALCFYKQKDFLFSNTNNKVARLFVTELSNYGNPLFKAVICLEYIAPLPPLLNIAIYAL